ncbi:DUF1657 domain-containing protein [Pseudalkalibacillus sp. A8]|uniref:DUF1657 domain-containing protein n=1 Tax=Pseudalkalibacillus sp. A8 TaxID=3382641 RepID=UPI0038B5FDF5
MTVASNVKQCLASLKGAKETLSNLALKSSDEQAKRTFHESMLEVEEIISDLQKRIGHLEFEEPQYKGK